MKIKQILRFAKDEFIYGGHLLSLGAASIVFTFAILLDIKITWDFLLIVYLITHTVYLCNRFIEFEKDFLTNSNRTQHVKKYIQYSFFIIFCFILIIVILLLRFGNFLSLIFGLLLLLFGIFYSLFFKNLTKKIIGFKNFYVSFFWALLVIFLIFYYSFFFNLPVFFLFSFVFLRWLINTIFFDIKDTESDKKDNLKTIILYLGKERTLFFLHIVNLISFLPIIIGVYKNVLSLSSLSLVVFYFYSFYYLQKAKDEKTNIYNLSYMMVDGEYLLWSIVLFLVNFIF